MANKHKKKMFNIISHYTAILENNLAVSYKVKNLLITQQFYSLGIYLNEIKTQVHKKNSYVHVYGNFIHKHSKLEKSKCPLRKG